MGTFSFAFCSISLTTGLDGTAATSVQIPGTFSGVVPVDPTNAGRYLKNIAAWSSSFVDGDAITQAQIVDTDGVVPVPIRAAFPNYPIIINLLDSGAGLDSEIQISSSNGISVEAFDAAGSPIARFLPGQLYLSLQVTAGLLGVGRNFRFVIRWGKWA